MPSMKEMRYYIAQHPRYKGSKTWNRKCMTMPERQYSDLYDVFYPDDGECYIINRGTGEYINWYKYVHIGRDIHSTVNPNDFVTFLEAFKGEK